MACKFKTLFFSLSLTLVISSCSSLDNFFSNLSLKEEKSAVLVENSKTTDMRKVESVVLNNDVKTKQNEELKEEKIKVNNSTNQEELLKVMREAGGFLQAYEKADNKQSFLRQRFSSYVDIKTGEFIKNLLKAYNGINAEISFNLNNLDTIEPSGKILIPFTPNNPKMAAYSQMGLTHSNQDRNIAHLGFGIRHYPQATSLENVGTYMFGYNIFLDRDIQRNHSRGSVGVEFMKNNIKLSSNAYHAISNWKNSQDFEKGYAEEKAASGIDLILQYAISNQLAIKTGIQKLFGENVAVFGDTNKFEKNPKILSAAIEYMPVPAIKLSAKHENSTSGNKNSSVEIGFNIPLDGSIKEAFNPRATNLASGYDLKSSRSMFVERDYKMPLKYRSKAGKYHINYCGQPDNNQYCFLVKDGLNKLAPNVATTVVADNKCVVFNNGGHYFTNVSGLIYPQIIESCVPQTKVTVSAGNSSERFDIKIQKLNFDLTAQPAIIERWQTSDVVLSYKSNNNPTSYPVAWSLEGPGSLSNADTNINNQAHVQFTPDTSLTNSYDVAVTATVQGVKYRVPIKVKVFGANPEDFILDKSRIEGTEITQITYSNLNPGSEVEFALTGSGKLSLNREATDLKDSLVVNVNDEGKAIVFVKADDVDAGNIHVEAKTKDPYFVAKSDINVHSYQPIINYPVNVEPNEEFSIKISGLKPNSQVTLSDGDYATLVNRNNYTVDASGNVTATYLAKAEYTAGKISNIKMNYYRNVDNADVQLNLNDISMKTYILSLTTDKDAIVADDSFVATLSGGKPGVEVEWSLTGNGEFVEKSTTFDDNGVAKATVKGIAPFTDDINVETVSNNKNLKKIVIIEDRTTQEIQLNVANMGSSAEKSTDTHIINTTVKSIEGSGVANGINLYINDVLIPLTKTGTNFIGTGCPYNGGGIGVNSFWKLDKQSLESLNISKAKTYKIKVINTFDDYGCKTYLNFKVIFNYKN